jgi:hypothetical protein
MGRTTYSSAGNEDVISSREEQEPPRAVSDQGRASQSVAKKGKKKNKANTLTTFFGSNSSRFETFLRSLHPILLVKGYHWTLPNGLKDITRILSLFLGPDDNHSGENVAVFPTTAHLKLFLRLDTKDMKLVPKKEVEGSNTDPRGANKNTVVFSLAVSYRHFVVEVNSFH